MKINCLLFSFIIILIFCLIPTETKENFWPIYNKNSWFKSNKHRYNNKLSNGILTRLDCKINLYGIIKGEYYCPTSMLDSDLNTQLNYPAKSVWFIKQRSGCAGGQVFPTYYKDLEGKLREVRDKHYRKIPDCHIPAYSEASQFIIQREIAPMLINGKKCDLRCYYVIINYNGNYEFYLGYDATFKINSNRYKKNSTGKKVQITNYAPNKLLVSDSGYYEIIYPKLIQLFTNLSRKLKPIFTGQSSKYQIEYQVCGADIIFDDLYNPYLLELNSGWPAYYPAVGASKKMTNVKLKINREISNIIYRYLNNQKFNNEYLVLLNV